MKPGSLLSPRSRTGSRLLGILLLAAALPAYAQTLSVRFDAAVTGCSDPSLNESFAFSFTVSAQPSGQDTIVQVDLGPDLDPFSFTLPSETVDQLVQAVGSTGGSISTSFGPEPAGPPGCDISGTIVISLGGGSQVGPNAPGNVATTTALLDTFARGSVPALGNRVRAVFQGNASGLTVTGNTYTLSGTAAGSGGAPIGIWAGYTYTGTENDFPTTAFDSDGHTVFLGFDTQPDRNWLLGVSLALEHTEVDTRFNGGEQSVTAVTVAPYMGVLLQDWLTVDASAGLGTVRTDQFRTAGATRVTSDLDSVRLFGSVNATATFAFDRLLTSARAGMLYATQSDDAFVESNGTAIPSTRSSVGRFLLGAEVAYAAGAWEPYLSGTLEHDFTRTRLVFAPGVAQPGTDDTGFLFAAGVRFFGDDDLSGSLEYSTVIDRRHLDEDTISANVRWSF